MTNDLANLDQRLREFDHVIAETRKSNESQHAAISAATRVVAWPLIVALLAVTTIGLYLHGDGWRDWTILFWTLLVGGLTTALVAIYAGIFLGSLAHWWFWRSNIPVVRMAVALALIFDGVLLSWALVPLVY